MSNSISSILSSYLYPSQTSNSTESYAAAGTAASSTDDGNSSAPRSSLLLSALQNSLSAIGIITDGTSTDSDPDASDSTSTTGSIPQALQSFMQSLFAALQASGDGTTSSQAATASDGASSAASTTAATGSATPPPPHRHHGGAGRLEAGVQNLIQNLSSASTDNTSSGDTDANSTLASLQSSFNNLLAASGSTDSGATLTSFLQTFGQYLQGSGPAGNVVHAQA